ncbi:hypothetical protein [Brevundimonas bacteroides]|uniref:hypothetical protein n=1 Tax=Brevundimonas bacteroides TaxID=74311 RepID=UPI0012EED658|nr:hypothetical protein [Brevundimonas bacteroides]
MSLPTAGWTTWAPVAAVPEGRAVQAASTSPADLEAVEAWTRRTLAVRPGEAAAWARLAWVAAERGDDAAANAYLDRSYTTAPFGPDITAWRLRFAYGRWGRLTPDLRRQADAELRATRRTRWAVVEAAAADVEDPAGRLAFTLAKQAEDRAQQARDQG